MPARRARRSVGLALVGLTRLFGVEAALFAAANAAVSPQSFENHFGGSRGGTRVFAIGNAKSADVLHQALDFRKLLITFAGCGQVRQLKFAAQFEPLDDGLKVDIREMFAEDAADGGANQFPGDSVRTLKFAFVFELHFAGDGGGGGLNIGNARRDSFVAIARRTLLGAADETFQRRDGKALADAGAAVHALFVARVENNI